MWQFRQPEHFKNDVLLDQFGKMVRSNSIIENPSKLIRATNLQLAPKTKAVYYVNIRNSPGIPRYISPVLITEKSLLLELLINSNDKWYILYLQLGALLIMGLYFLTQLIFKRSQILAYYNLYLFFMLIYLSRGIFMNHPTTHFYPPGFYDYFYYSIITMAVLISYIQFIKSVIQQVIPTETKLVSILNWMILGSCLWFICDRALLMYDYSIAWKFSNIFHVLSMSFYFIMSIRLLQFKNSILTIIAIGTLVLNLFFLSMIIAKIMISFSDSPMGVWIHPATCLAVLAELFLFIVSIKKMESFEKLKTQHVLQTVKREKDALIHNVTRTNNIRRHEQDLDFIDRIDSIISDNMDNSQFNANQLYHILGTNHVSLNKKLKEILNMSTHQYIQHKKLEHSKQLVLKSDISFSEIAYQIGLNDSAYFSKLFKKKFGKSPSSFRKQLGNHAQIQNSPI